MAGQDDISDLAAALRMFIATYEADRDWTKDALTSILARFDRLEIRIDHHSTRIGALDRRVDDLEKRLSRLEGKGQEP